jgi:ubiquinone/menaquinone biosynthesis C-methylase UbiE
MSSDFEPALDRIRAENSRRAREVDPEFYALHRPANLFMRHSQDRALIWALTHAHLLPLRDRAILDLGCGAGSWLAVFENLGAQRANLSGIELDEARVVACRQRFPGADIRQGDASRLPWSEERFDVVLQSTVFTSILDGALKHAVAAEMVRVLKPQGAIIWYDFHVNNPRNPHVRGVGRREIEALFPGCQTSLRRTTLAPPLARRVVPISWPLAVALEGLALLNTHYIGVVQKPA